MKTGNLNRRDFIRKSAGGINVNTLRQTKHSADKKSGY
jgi:hypothetical protein